MYSERLTEMITQKNTTEMAAAWRGEEEREGTEDRLAQPGPRGQKAGRGRRSLRGLQEADEAADFRVFGDPGEEKVWTEKSVRRNCSLKLPKFGKRHKSTDSRGWVNPKEDKPKTSTPGHTMKLAKTMRHSRE